jgi:hypothetical protein
MLHLQTAQSVTPRLFINILFYFLVFLFGSTNPYSPLLQDGQIREDGKSFLAIPSQQTTALYFGSMSPF